MASRLCLFTVPPSPLEAMEQTRLALAAHQGDAPARNQLFANLAAPIAVAIKRYRWSFGQLDDDEVTSESFLALVDLIEYWPDVPFADYFDRTYAVCLKQRLRALAPPAWWARPSQPIDLDRPSPAAAQALAMADQLCDLPPAVGWVVEHWPVGARPGDLAGPLGCSPRDAQRRWKTLVGRLAQQGRLAR